MNHGTVLGPDTAQPISQAHDKADTLEQRVSALENQLQRTNETLVQLLRALETRFGDDIDGDGRVG